MAPMDARHAILALNSRTAEEWFRIGSECLSDGTEGGDYEQAAFCYLQASALGHTKALERLEELTRNGKGVKAEASVLNAQDRPKHTAVEAEGAARSILLSPRVALEYNPSRCPACGATVFRSHPHVSGGYVCSIEEGGCGVRLYIPIKEVGLRAGLAIQPYKVRQEPVEYSFLGRCIHEVKYDESLSDSSKRDLMDEAVARMRECCVVENLLGWQSIDGMVVTPAPSSRYRKLQPVNYLTRGLSEGKLEYAELLWKRSTKESKDRTSGTELDDGDVVCRYAMGGRSILLVDDTYGEGATLRACLRALKQSGAGDVYYLSLCKNTYGGMKGRR